MNGYRHFAGLKGSKLITVGSDASVYNYTGLAAAVAAAQNNDVILLETGTHTLTEQLLINKPLTIKSMSTAGVLGVGGTIITGPDDMTEALIKIELVAQSAASVVMFDGVTIKQSTDDVDVVTANNTTVAQTLSLCFKNCSILSFDNASTGKGLEVAHADATKAVYVFINGQGGMHRVDYVNMAVKNASDAITITDMICHNVGGASAVVTSADDLAAQVNFVRCIIPHELGSSGGHGTQLVRALGSFSLTGTTYALVDTNDLIGNHAETLLPVS